MYKRLLSFTFYLISCAATAQTLTLEQAHRMARDNYPLIRRYELIRQTEQFTLSNIQKGWLPQISAEAQATYQSDVTAWPSTIQGLYEQMGLDMKGLKKDQYRIGISIQQQLYDGGNVRAQREVAQAESKVQQAQNDVDLYALRQRVDDIFFSLLLTDQRIALNQEMQRTLQSNEDRLQALTQGGVAMQADVDAVRAERLTAMQQQEQLGSVRQALLSVLSLYVGQAVTAVELPAEVGQPAGQIANNRPEQQLFNQQIALTHARERQLRSALMPRLGVFATGFYGYPGYNMFEDMMAHEWSLNGMVGAKLQWNVGALYTNKNNRRKLATQRQQIETARETFLFNTNLQSQQESHTILGYRRMLRHDDEIIALRRSVRQAAEAKLQHGTVDVNTLVQEITRENQAKLNRSSHHIEMLQHQYKYAALIND